MRSRARGWTDGQTGARTNGRGQTHRGTAPGPGSAPLQGPGRDGTRGTGCSALPRGSPNPCPRVRGEGLHPPSLLPRRGWLCLAAAGLHAAPALPLGVLCTATAGRGALPGLGREMRETTRFPQVNHPCWKRRDQSCAGTAHKERAGLLEKLPPTPNGASSRDACKSRR